MTPLTPCCCRGLEPAADARLVGAVGVAEGTFQIALFGRDLAVLEAADTVWTLSSAEVHQLLTVDRRWTAEQYERWLGDTLIALLLPPEASPSP